MSQDQRFEIDSSLEGQALTSALRRLLPGESWSQVKRRIATRRVCVNGTLCLDEGRRLKAGDRIDVYEHSRPPVPSEDNVRIVHQDEHLIVVDKPAGMITVRRPEERKWSERRKARQPTLEETVERLLADAEPYAAPPRLRTVHRLDRDTSGLMLLVLSPEAQQKLVHMFKRHQVERAYVAVVHGYPKAQTIETRLVRDRGDGLRGSAPRGTRDANARKAVTHVRPLERIGDFARVDCRLETGRTHQIRIHLSEIGHPVCGEKRYTHPLGEAPIPDRSGAPRQALHSAELSFTHPVTAESLRFTSPLPGDLSAWLDRLRRDARNR